MGLVNIWKKYRDFILLFLVLILLVSFLVKFQFNQFVVNDEQRINYTALNFGDYQSMRIYDSLNSQYQTCIFSAASLASVNNHTYPLISSSEVIFYLPFSILFKEKFLVFTNYLFSIFSVVLLYVLVRRLSNSSFAAIFASLIFALSPFFLKWSLGFFDIIPAVFFFILATFFIFSSRSKYRFLFAGFSLLVLSMIRPSESLFMFPVLLAMYLQSAKKTDYLLFLGTMVLFGLTILLGNNLLFGGYFNFPQLNALSFPCLNSLTSPQNYFSLNWNYILTIFFHIKFFILFFSFAFPWIIPGIISLIFLYNKRKDFVLFSFFVWVILLLTYGRTTIYYGFGQENLQSSFVRYSAFSFCLLSIAASLYIKDFISKFRYPVKKVILFLILLLLMLTMLYAYTYQLNGVENYNQKRIYTYDISKNVSYKIVPDAIVLTDAYTNKMISLDGNVSQIQFDKLISFSDYSLALNETDRVLVDIFRDNRSVYFFGQVTNNQTQALMSHLDQRYELYQIDSGANGLINLYNIRLK